MEKIFSLKKYLETMIETEPYEIDLHDGIILQSLKDDGWVRMVIGKTEEEINELGFFSDEDWME